jgi:hypothetical protein
MCGRYRRTTAEEELGKRYNIPIPRQTLIEWSFHPRRYTWMTIMPTGSVIIGPKNRSSLR